MKLYPERIGGYDEIMKAQVLRIIMGLATIIVGIAFLLGNLEVLNFSELASRWWPLAVILAGILIFINDTKSYLWAILVSGVGILWQLQRLDITDVNPWQLFWPAVIIIVGLSILMNRSATRLRVNKVERDDAIAILGGSDQRNTSEDFKGSKVTAVMGGVKLDLRKAVIKKEATVEIFTFWGGVELIVPPNVLVKNQTSAILGGVEDRSDRESDKNAPVLYVVGDVIMGGVEIKS